MSRRSFGGLGPAVSACPGFSFPGSRAFPNEHKHLSDFAIRRLSPTVLLATGLGLGFSRVAPGTLGAVWGLPLAWGIAQIPSLWVQAAVIVGICAAGVPIATLAARRLGGGKDPQCIVLDEIVSLPITFFLVPAAAMNSVWILAAGFLLHRLFDITKVPPARQLERLPEGLGIMADDWAAGVYSCAALHGLLWLAVIR